MQIKPHAEAQSPQRKAALYDVDMRPHPRIRKTIKYGGAALTVLLVALWIASGWWRVDFQKMPLLCVLFPGQVLIMHSLVPDNYRGSTWQVSSQRRGMAWSWRPQIILGNAAGRFLVMVPLWMPVTASLLPTALAFRLDTLARRRERGGVNLCPTCHYDRTGLAGDAVCPECGAAAK